MIPQQSGVEPRLTDVRKVFQSPSNGTKDFLSFMQTVLKRHRLQSNSETAGQNLRTVVANTKFKNDAQLSQRNNLDGLSTGLMVPFFREEGDTSFVSQKGLPFEISKLADSLRSFLQKNGFRFDGVNVDSTALSDLKKLLMDIGGESNQVETVIKRISLEMGDGRINLSTLFSKVAEHFQHAYDTHQEMMDISALPFIEAVLAGFRIPPEKIKNALSAACVEAEGIHVPRLVSELKKINLQRENVAISDGMSKMHVLSNARQIGVAFGGHPSHDASLSGQTSRTDSETTSDVPGRLKENQHVTLEKFISGLEAKVSRGMPQPASHAQLSNDLKRFIEKCDYEQNNQLSSSTITVQDKEALLNRFAEGQEKAVSTGGLPADNANNRTLPFASKLFDDMTTVDHEEQKLTSQDIGKNVSKQSSKQEYSTLVAHSHKVINEGMEPVGKNTNSAEATLQKKSGDLQKEIGSIPNPADTPSLSEKHEFSGTMDQSFRERLSAQTASSVKDSGAGSKTLPSYLLNQVSRQMLKSIQRGENELRLQLKPPQLGRLQMSIETVTHGVKVSILAEQQSTREVLMSHTGELKAMLQEQGIRLEKVDIQMTFNFDQSMADARREANGTGERKKGGRHRSKASGAEEKRQVHAARPQAHNNRLLNLVA